MLTCCMPLLRCCALHCCKGQITAGCRHEDGHGLRSVLALACSTATASHATHSNSVCLQVMTVKACSLCVVCGSDSSLHPKGLSKQVTVVDEQWLLSTAETYGEGVAIPCVKQ